MSMLGDRRRQRSTGRSPRPPASGVLSPIDDWLEFLADVLAQELLKLQGRSPKGGDQGDDGQL